MTTFFYYCVKVYIKLALFFYCNKIKINGLDNIPKKGAVLLVANHPNGLIDPLLIASSIQRKTHFLVRAAVFKNPNVAKLLNWLGMMPVYRRRDGLREVAKNNSVFVKCQELLNHQKMLLIFPEGSHLRKRTVRPLSKGFARIITDTLLQYPDLTIHIVPVGITYQNPSVYPCKAAVSFGKSILVNTLINPEDCNAAFNILRSRIASVLQQLSVHIPDDLNYAPIEASLIEKEIDFTEVKTVNKMIRTKSNASPPKISSTNVLYLLKLSIIINSFIPYYLWKKIELKISEIEFKDTFRFGFNSVLFPLFYTLQAYAVFHIWNTFVALLYFIASFLVVLMYTKLKPITPG